MKLVTLLIFSTILTTSLFSYDNNQGKIDMHGGKSDSLIPKQGFSQNFQTLGSINEKKTEEEKSDRNFLKIEEIEKIEKEKEKMSKYKFVSWNVNGIRAVDKKEALKWVDEANIDLLGIQETKSTKEQIPSTIFNREYKTLLASESAIKGRSGTALFTDIEPTFTCNCPSVDILDEGRINEIHFTLGDKDIAFFNVYFPNGQSKEERLTYKMEFYDRFLDHCENLKKEGKSIIVCGDVNTAHTEIDLARPKANEETSGFLPMERDWITKFLSHGYLDTFRLINGDEPHNYSWWSYRANARENNVGWRIDYFYVSEDLKDNVKNAYIMSEVFGSDHCPIAIEIDF